MGDTHKTNLIGYRDLRYKRMSGYKSKNRFMLTVDMFTKIESPKPKNSPAKAYKRNLEMIFKTTSKNSTVSKHVSFFREIERMTRSERKQKCFANDPYKVLDAPGFSEDFYVNILDWGQQNNVSIALGPVCYIWNHDTKNIQKIQELDGDKEITSVKFSGDSKLAIGTSAGHVEVFDVDSGKSLYLYTKNNSKVLSMAWNGNIIAYGSTVGNIELFDCRSGKLVSLLSLHKKEVCGLEWNCAKNTLASGGNDDTVGIWSIEKMTPIHTIKAHTSAVKAIAWSHTNPNVLVTGGGLHDRAIKVWDTIDGRLMFVQKTGSQICGVRFSKDQKELIVANGYSMEGESNTIKIYRYPSMKEIHSVSAHESRITQMAMSLDKTKICTASSDESLKFWHFFDDNTDAVPYTEKGYMHRCPFR